MPIVPCPCGGIAGLDIQDEGVAIGAGPYDTLNFTGAGVTATDAGGGVAQIAIPGQPMALPEQWAAEGLSGTVAATSMAAQVSTNFDTVKAIRGGSIIGLGTRLVSAITAGSLLVEVTINGVATALSLNHTNALNTTGGQATQAPGAIAYNAGDLIGLQYTQTFLGPAGNAVEAWLEVFETV